MKRIGFLLLGFTLLALFRSAPAAAQTFDASKLGTPAVTVTGNWRVEYGDNPAWARPDFDDSSWQLQPAGQELNVDHRYRGYLWYRMRVELPPHHGPLSVSIDNCTTSYEVYANGAPIGHYGGMPPHEARYETPLVAYSLGVAPDVTTAEIAIRVWSHTLVSKPGLRRNGVRIGALPAIANEVAEYKRAVDEQALQYWLGNVASLALSLVVLALFAFQPDHKEYLWLALWQLAGTIAGFISTAVNVSLITYWYQYDVGIPLQFVSLVLMLEFYYAFVHERPGRWIRALQAVLLLTIPIGPFILYRHPAPRIYGSLVLLPGFEVIIIAVVTAAMLTVWFRRGNREAGLLLIPTVLANLSSIINLFVEAGYALGWLKSPANPIPDTHLGNFPFSADTWFGFLFILAIMVLLFNRFLNVSRQQMRSAAEIEAARQVQQLLLPEKLLSIPTVEVESEYHPADVVGGDFFQVIPANDGSLLVVVGDVAGKGMGAAMLVGVIIGTIRTAVGFDADPAFVLATLNERLCGRVEGSFVTCLVARLTAQGELTVANAGHLSPYLNGEELPTIPELPLGVAPGVGYATSRFSIAPGDHLTFVSDGVVEATRANGELFGFERTREISRDSASVIAQAAKAFGQTDDITVLSLTRVAELAPAALSRGWLP